MPANNLRSDKIWMDGAMVPYDEATVHVLTHSLHYGLAVFEGMRCYKSDDGRSAIFRAKEHIRRLLESGHIVEMEVPYSSEELLKACADVVRVNKFAECYIRPLVFFGEGEMGLSARGNKIRVSIAAWPWGAYLGSDSVAKGVRLKTSSLEGFVAEGSGENVFVVRDGVVRTPPLTSVLAGITRDAVIKILSDAGVPVREEYFARDAFYIADEAFMTGTAAEVTPVVELDDRKIGPGKPGPITQKVQATFHAALHGREPRYRDWLYYV
jgi:branched-chain amino acid aminotransferase